MYIIKQTTRNYDARKDIYIDNIVNIGVFKDYTEINNFMEDNGISKYSVTIEELTDKQSYRKVKK
jgi:hypothetical protein